MCFFNGGKSDSREDENPVNSGDRKVYCPKLLGELPAVSDSNCKLSMRI